MTVTVTSSHAHLPIPRMGNRGRMLADFIGCERGRPALLLGKGPSLELALAQWPMLIDGTQPVVCVVNDLAGLVHAHYCFAADPVLSFADRYGHGDILFYRARHMRATGACPPVACEVIPFWDEPALPPTADPITMANVGLATRLGSVSMAAQIIALMGCSRIVAAGIDGGTGRADISWATPECSGYSAIRAAFIDTCAALRMPLEFIAPASVLEVAHA
jgi:hypothetical protein